MNRTDNFRGGAPTSKYTCSAFLERQAGGEGVWMYSWRNIGTICSMSTCEVSGVEELGDVTVGDDDKRPQYDGNKVHDGGNESTS